MPKQTGKEKPDLDDFNGNLDINPDDYAPDTNEGTLDEKMLLDDIDLESVQKSVDAGVIIPTIKFVENEPISLVVISRPYTFTSDFGLTIALKVNYKEMEHSLIVPKSLKFQLLTEMVKKKMITIDDIKNNTVNWNVLINKLITVKKSKGNTKQYKNAMLYSVQIHV